MPVISVVWLQFQNEIIARGFWDQGMIEDLLHNEMGTTGYDFDHYEGPFLPPSVQDGVIVVFPARNQVQYLDKLNAFIAMFPWVVLILTGDEESVFPIEQIEHPNIRIWVMSPKKGRHDAYTKIGSGYPPHLRELMPHRSVKRSLDYFFSGQINHERRAQCVEQLSRMTGGEYVETEGFTQGLPHETYARLLATSKTAPCPSGAWTPDTFRFFEALEAGCVPIADTRTVLGESWDDYWGWFFGEHPPFPILRFWEDLPEFTRVSVAAYPALNNQCFAWWQRQKYQLVLTLREQIQELSGLEPEIGKITVIMPTSPTILHPSTEHIRQTIKDVRVHLPDAQIILMIDGVRPEQERLRASYEQYQRRLLWLCNYEWTNVLPVRFEQFHHQSGMMNIVLPMIDTPLMLFVEHDTPLTPDRNIEWPKLIEAIESGDANTVRFHFEAHVLEEHEHLMLSGVEDVHGAKMRKTVQWSQRPHLSSVAFYRWMMETQFRPESRAFIEHGAYGQFLASIQRDGIMGWNLWKLWMYTPDEGDGQIKRSYDLNSRGEEPNYESTF